MSPWRHVTHGLRALFAREAADRDIADEVDAYLEEATSALIANGLPPDEARRRARLELGGVTAVREQVRAHGWENVVQAVAEDVRFGARQLRKNPAFAALSVLTLALGIGATTAIFSVAKPVLFGPLPYPDPDRIVAISGRAPDGTATDVSFGTFRELTARSRGFDALSVFRPWQPTLTGTAEPERLDGQRVSAAYFRVLGVAPFIGGGFDPDDDRIGGPDVVILAYSLWRDRLGADSTIVGNSITLDGRAHTVVGVMGPEFENVVAPAARVWGLLQYDVALGSFESREWGNHLQMAGRVARDVPPIEAAREVERIAASPIAELPRPPWSALEGGFVVTDLKDEVTRIAKPGLLAILGAVSLLLLLSCINLTNLLLGRGMQRRGELAMRATLGARPARLVQQLLTESLVLAFLGGAIGIALGAYGVRALIALSPPQLPRLGAVGMDVSVFAVALGITTVVGVGAGLVPALRASREAGQGGSRESAARTTGSHRLARKALVVVEVSLTLILLVGAGLLMRSLDRLFAIDPGFAASQGVALQVQASAGGVDGDDATRRNFADVLQAVRAVPGVSGAALTSQLPLSGEADEYGIRAAADEALDPGEGGVLRYAVSPGYLEAMGIPLRLGRTLGVGDIHDPEPAAVISESLAERLYPGRNPLGRRVHIGRTDLPPYTVVGVVGDVKQISLASARTDAAYVDSERWAFADRTMWIVARVEGDASGLVPAIRAAIWSVDPDQPIVRISTLDALVAASAAERRFSLRLFGAFALSALILAGIGLYGVLSGSVSERMREMGVRSALGATRADLLTLVVRQGMLLTAFGILLGLGGAAAMGRSLATLLFGVSPFDPITYVGVILLLTTIAAAACAVPAWRAGRVDPASTLRVG